ncbi:MAG: hypothetical protein JNL73_10505 [Anaerolineales bacterium]|nr:hypothetical protein [Anaerolineales bacterium]
MGTYSTYLLPGIAFVLTVGTGIWLSRLGKPLNGVLFTIHKLIALGAVIAAAIPLAYALRSAPAPALAFVLLGIGGLGSVALFATGALLSLNPSSAVGSLHWVHRIAPLVVVVTVGWALVLLVGARG